MTLLFDIRVLWHSLTFTVRFLNTTFAFWIPSESLRSLRHSFQRVKSRGSAIAVPEFASWIPRRLPQLFPRTLLIAVEKLYNRREKRSKYKFSETGNISGDDTVVARSILHGYRMHLRAHGPVCRPFYLGKLIDATIWSCMIGCRTQLLHDGSAPHGTVQQPCPRRNCFLFDAVGTYRQN